MEEIENLRQQMIKTFKEYNDAPEHNRTFLWDSYTEARESYLRAAAAMNKGIYQELKYQLVEYD